MDRGAVTMCYPIMSRELLWENRTRFETVWCKSSLRGWPEYWPPLFCDLTDGLTQLPITWQLHICTATNDKSGLTRSKPSQHICILNELGFNSSLLCWTPKMWMNYYAGYQYTFLFPFWFTDSIRATLTSSYSINIIITFSNWIL